MKTLIYKTLTSKTLYLLIITLGLIAYNLQSIQPSFSDFTLTTPSGNTKTIGTPGFIQSPESGVYRLVGTVEMTKNASSTLRIIPDDEILSLVVNQRPVDLSHIPYEQRKDYNKGFTYDLSEYLHDGKNQIEILSFVARPGPDNYYRDELGTKNTRNKKAQQYAGLCSETES